MYEEKETVVLPFAADECARQYLNRYANAYYARELNLTPRALWLDFTKDKSYEKQL